MDPKQQRLIQRGRLLPMSRILALVAVLCLAWPSARAEDRTQGMNPPLAATTALVANLHPVSAMPPGACALDQYGSFL